MNMKIFLLILLVFVVIDATMAKRNIWGNSCKGKKKDCEKKTTAGECCVFPFKYRGETYDSCTTKDNGNVPWCATTANYDTDKKWGNCQIEDCEKKTKNGECCVFPFIYRGQTYDSCTTKDNGNVPWCATTANYDTDKKWGNCQIEDCEKKTKNGECCVFPFIYRGQTHDSCTTKDNGNVPWCATTANYDTDKKWGNCQIEDCEKKTKNGECCVFPFIYRGQTYDSCTTKDNGNVPWCATTANYDTDKKWGNCI